MTIYGQDHNMTIYGQGRNIDLIWVGLSHQALLTLDESRFNDLHWRLRGGLLWPREQSWGGGEELCSEGREGTDMIYTPQKGRQETDNVSRLHCADNV